MAGKIEGRKPKPTRLKVLEGNPGKRPLNENEPKPPPIAPECPGWLGLVAKAEWERIAPQLEKLSLLTGLDMAVLASYCRTYGELVEANKFLKKNGLTYTTAAGYHQQYPQVVIARKAQDEIRTFSSLFGLTPSDRSRMSVPGAADSEDELEGIMRRKGV